MTTGPLCTSTCLDLRDSDMDKTGSKPAPPEPELAPSTLVTRSPRHMGTCGVCDAFPDGQVPSQRLFPVAAQHSLRLLRTDFMNHPSSYTFRLLGLGGIAPLLFKWVVPVHRVTRNVAEWAFRTSPPLAVSFHFYRFCSFNTYDTGPRCLNILLFDYC